MYLTYYVRLAGGKNCLLQYSIFNKSKGRAVSLQPWTGPEGSRRVRLPDFKTTGT